MRLCNRCLQPLPQNAPEGLCPKCLAKAALETEPAAAGQRNFPKPEELTAQFPQLEIIELLGAGGMGMVYKARQPRLDREVALKLLPIGTGAAHGFGERFAREAKALAKLNHPGIVTVYDFGETSDYCYFVMEYVDGMNLRRLLQAQLISPRQALDLVVQICTALQFAHDEGIVHRDIKPENILINKKGQVKIADFGLAKLLGATSDTSLTQSQAVMGTLNYMAPEQRERSKDVDHRADIYSLGVVFYEMLTGEVPMGRFEAPSKMVQIDVRLDEVVLHALEREPARRYQQVSEVKTGVESITATMPREEKSTSAPAMLKPKPPPGFASYVLKRIAILILAWVGAVSCLHWALRTPAITLNDSGGAVFRIISEILGVLDLGKIFLPLAVAAILFSWLEARERRGLSRRALPPEIRRRFAWQLTFALSGSYAFVALATTWLVMEYASSGITHEETAQWWFVPRSRGV